MKLRKREARAGGESEPVWSVSSLMEVVPESPSPICSSPRTSSMDFSSEFFTPRHQNGLGSAIGGTDFSNLSFSRDLKWKQDQCSSPRTRQSMSTVYESTFTSLDQHVCQGSPSREIPKPVEFHHRLSRPRPYQEFLDQVQSHQKASEMEAWKESTRLKVQTKLRRKEAEIAKWEMEQKNKARCEMEIVERKIEMIRAKALKKIQKKIVEASKAAEKQRARERQAALKKMARVAKRSDKIQATKCGICLKLHKLLLARTPNV